ncbi:MAG: cytosine permease [Steroidobacteraceae bacterium]
MDSGRLLEQHTIDYIPLAERRGKVWHLWPIWFAGDAHLATLAVGVIGLALGANLLWTTLAVVGGCALGTVFMAFHSTQGPQLGLPQLIQSRPQFGYYGALLVWVVALVAYIGYNAFNQVLVSGAVHQLAGREIASDPVVMVTFALLAAAIAAVGYHWIHRAQRWVAYVTIAMLLVFTAGAGKALHLPADAWRLGEFPAIPFLVQFFAAAAYQLSWSIYVSDYSRYLPPDVSVRASFFWTSIGAFVGGVWMMLVGTLAAAYSPQAEIPAALQAAGDAVWPGLGTALLAVAVLGLLTITTLNFYGASLTLLSITDCFRRTRAGAQARIVSLAVAVVLACTIALAASADFVHRFEDLLAVLLYLFTPWTAINLVDYFWVRKGHYSVREIFNPDGLYGKWNWRGLLAYAVGFVAMIPFVSTGLYTGPIADLLGGADLSMLVGLPVSTLVYLWACRDFDAAGELLAVQRADAGLDPGPPRARQG